jgi:hypothetical protein
MFKTISLLMALGFLGFSILFHENELYKFIATCVLCGVILVRHEIEEVVGKKKE